MKPRFTYDLDGTISQKRTTFITTAVRTSNPLATYFCRNNTHTCLASGKLLVSMLASYNNVFEFQNTVYLAINSETFSFINLKVISITKLVVGIAT
jgi:hypothetical protein